MFWAKTLVSMATDSFHRVIMGKRLQQVFAAVFDRILFILAGNGDICGNLVKFEIWPDSNTDYICTLTFNGENGVSK